MAEVVRSLEPEARLPDDSKQLPPIYRSVLQGRRLILLADNAAGKSQTEPLTPPSGCLFLVTSRRQFHIRGLQSRNLDVLSTEDAGALVQRICPRVSQAEAESLGERVGRLPLAVCLAASALEVRQDWPTIEYLDRLADARERLGLRDEEESVEASISLSWDLLSQEDRALLAQLSMFPAPFDRAAVTAVWELEEKPADDALGRLQKVSLVQWDAGPLRYRLHDLVRDFLAEKLGEEERLAAHLRYGSHYLDVLSEVERLYMDRGDNATKGLTLFDQERIHLETSFHRLREAVDKHRRAAELITTYPIRAREVQDLRQTPHEQIEWLQAGLMAARRLGDRNFEGIHLVNLANAHYRLGAYDLAKSFYLQALEPLKEARNRRDEAVSYHQLGVVTQERRSYDEAQRWYKKSLAIKKDLSNLDGMAASYHQLGVMAHSRGFYKEALEWCGKTLEIDKKSKNRAGIAASYEQLGILAQDRGHYRKAWNWYQKSLAIDKELDDQAGMASTYHRLGGLAQKRRSYNEARDWYMGSLEIRERRSDRAGMARTICALGSLATVQGHPEKGMPLNLRSLGIHLEIGSPEGDFNLHWLTRQREMLGEEQFGDILAEHLDEESREAVLWLLAEYEKSQDGEGEAEGAAPSEG